MTEWITVKEAAKRLLVSERNVRFKIQTGRLKAKRDGRKWLVHISLSPALSDNIGQGMDTPSDTEYVRMFEAEIEKRDRQIEEKDKQIIKLQNDLSEASQRHDTIVLQLTRQLEQSQRMLEAHQVPLWRRLLRRKPK